jgi:hypothetical protein
MEGQGQVVGHTVHQMKDENLVICCLSRAHYFFVTNSRYKQS